MVHILERFVIHFAASAFLLLAVYFLLSYWMRRNAKVARWLSDGKEHLLVTSAIIVFALATLREPFDVSSGQTVIKAVFDQISWFAGCAVSAWGLYRLKK